MAHIAEEAVSSVEVPAPMKKSTAYVKFSFKSCKNVDEQKEVHECSMLRCIKSIHHDCFMTFIQKSSLDAFVDESAITCATKTCYGKW